MLAVPNKNADHSVAVSYDPAAVTAWAQRHVPLINARFNGQNSNESAANVQSIEPLPAFVKPFPFPALPAGRASLYELNEHFLMAVNAFELLNRCFQKGTNNSATLLGFKRPGDQQIAHTILHAISNSCGKIFIVEIGAGGQAFSNHVGRPWLGFLFATAFKNHLRWQATDLSSSLNTGLEYPLFNTETRCGVDYFELKKSYKQGTIDLVCGRHLVPRTDDFRAELAKSIETILGNDGRAIISYDGEISGRSSSEVLKESAKVSFLRSPTT